MIQVMKNPAGQATLLIAYEGSAQKLLDAINRNPPPCVVQVLGPESQYDPATGMTDSFVRTDVQDKLDLTKAELARVTDVLLGYQQTLADRTAQLAFERGEGVRLANQLDAARRVGEQLVSEVEDAKALLSQVRKKKLPAAKKKKG